MKDCTFELIVNILTYAVKHKEDSFSQKDFKNVVYTDEFNNFDINEKISDGCDYLLKRGLLQLENSKVTYYEKYKLPETIKINTADNTKVYKDLAKRIILMHEGKDMINDTYEVKDDFADVIESVDFINSKYLSAIDTEELKITLSKILISLNKGSGYSLLTILQLLKLKSSMILKMKNENSEFFASNIKFSHIQFNDTSTILFFDKCSFEIDSLEAILEIQSVDELSLSEHLSKSLDLLEKYDNIIIKKLKDFLKTS
jgi:hypothetical protein